ncbi:MAG: lipoprotein insertase outer membrane protein LolB [Pseudoxanthomonas sp.]
MKPKWLLLATLLLSACATQTRKPAPPPVAADVAEQRQLAREDRLGGIAEWNFSGRFAVGNGKDGGSGRIEWRQEQGKGPTGVSIITLSAPVTRQSWRLTVYEGDSATLEGLTGGTRSGSDAVALLKEATGWEIPVPALKYWVRGLRVPGAPVAGQQFDEQARLVRLRQEGWTIDYQWAEPVAGDPPMPRRIDAMQGQAKVKLIFDRWL